MQRYHIARCSPRRIPPAEEAHEAAHDDDRGDGDACNGARAEVGVATSHKTIATGRESTVTYTSTFTSCGVLGTGGHTRAPSRAHLLTIITRLAHPVRTAVGAVSHLAIEAFAAGLVGFVSLCCTCETLDRIRLLGARRTVSYATISLITTGGAYLRAVYGSCGEVSAGGFAISFCYTLPGFRSIIFDPEVLFSVGSF